MQQDGTLTVIILKATQELLMCAQGENHLDNLFKEVKIRTFRNIER
jgi:hypothetical protein